MGTLLLTAHGDIIKNAQQRYLKQRYLKQRYLKHVLSETWGTVSAMRSWVVLMA